MSIKEVVAIIADLVIPIKNRGRVFSAWKEPEAFSAKWDGKYASISRTWRRHWENVNPLFDYPNDESAIKSFAWPLKRLRSNGQCLSGI